MNYKAFIITPILWFIHKIDWKSLRILLFLVYKRIFKSIISNKKINFSAANNKYNHINAILKLK